MSGSPVLFVSGASGQLGRRVVSLLLAQGHRVVAGSRRPEALAELAASGAELRTVDFARPETVAAALQGVDRALLISTDAVGARLDAQREAVTQAARAGVSHLVYTSATSVESPELLVGPEHLGTETAIRENFDSYTILRNNLYVELAVQALDQAAASGQLVTARGTGGVAWVAREDCARAAAAALADGFTGARTLDITGPAALTGEDMAALAAARSGKPVVHVAVSPEQLSEGLRAAGLPGPLVDLLVNFDTAAAAGLLGRVSPDLEQLTGQPGRSLEAVLAAGG
jgi:NAD(P)H dehydrogenase (quinone)